MLHPSELRCTFWECCTLLSTGHSTELRFTLLNWAAPYWAALRSTELCCTLLSYVTPYWAPLRTDELRCTMLSSHHCIMRPTELYCPLLNYTLYLLINAAPYWAQGALLSCASPYCATLHPLNRTKFNYSAPSLSYAAPYWATLYTTELQCTLLSYAAPCKLSCTLAKLPTTLVCIFFKCRTRRNQVSSVPEWKEKKLQILNFFINHHACAEHMQQFLMRAQSIHVRNLCGCWANASVPYAYAQHQSKNSKNMLSICIRNSCAPWAYTSWTYAHWAYA
jgi:hypothetical protein